MQVPTAVEDAARDLVRAREDVRGDPMHARHRVSKLLLQAMVYTGPEGTGARHTTRGFSCYASRTRR